MVLVIANLIYSPFIYSGVNTFGPLSAETDLRMKISKLIFFGTKQFFGSCVLLHSIG